MNQAERDVAEAVADKELERIGYAGDAKTYRLRQVKMIEQATRDVGPLAQHRRMMKRLGPPPRFRWPVLTTAWNEPPTTEWLAALAKDGKK